MVSVLYRSPIIIDAFFARPTALCAPQRVERSDPIARTEATRGPRRLKGLVMGTQGDGERPAAGSRRRSLGKKYRTTNLHLDDGMTNHQRVGVDVLWFSGANQRFHACMGHV